MAGLVLKLAPNERIYVNGALIENGERRTSLRLPMRETDILRERDIIPNQTPTDVLVAACILAQTALMQRDARYACMASLNAQFRALLHDPIYRHNAAIRAAASRLAEGSLAGAHHWLLRAHRDREPSIDGKTCQFRPPSRPQVHSAPTDCPT